MCTRNAFGFSVYVLPCCSLKVCLHLDGLDQQSKRECTNYIACCKGINCLSIWMRSALLLEERWRDRMLASG